jgi:hypothetical protein
MHSTAPRALNDAALCLCTRLCEQAREELENGIQVPYATGQPYGMLDQVRQVSK